MRNSNFARPEVPVSTLGVADRSTDPGINLLEVDVDTGAWFALKYLLGVDNVKNYDGSWTGWGNLIGAPVETGAAPVLPDVKCQ